MFREPLMYQREVNKTYGIQVHYMLLIMRQTIYVVSSQFSKHIFQADCK